jgi:AGCS family alanine or glycine:cation symporter
VRQALVSATGTFWDTVVVCALTGIVVVNSGGWQQGLSGSALTKFAFEDLHVVGPIVLTIGLLTFVFSTILGWAYYGEKAAEYLFGLGVISYYRMLWDRVMTGSVSTLTAVELLGRRQRAHGRAEPHRLLALNGVIVSETRDYLWSGNLDKSSGSAPPRSGAA